MTEYFLLALCVSFPLYVYGVRGIWLLLLAGIICVGFAGLDEYRLHGGEVVIPGPEIGNMIVNEELTAKEFRDNPSIVLPLMDDFVIR